ncbi:MAG: hypothetical protein WCI56_10665 [Hyphomicrobiales bacterium]
MLAAKAIEEYRAGLIRQCKQEKEHVEAQLADLEAKNRDLSAKMKRLGTEIPNPESCPVCYYLTGEVTPVRPIPANPNRPRIDLFRCRNGHDF